MEKSKTIKAPRERCPHRKKLLTVGSIISNMTNLTKFSSEMDLKTVLASQYMKQIENFFADKKQAMKFLSSVMADVQKNPKLLECTPTSVINSYMTMAQLGLMPSGISGEAYVLPYNIKGQMVAQFQLGYQGLVTLFYRAGVKAILAETIRKNDKFSYENGVVKHEIDILKSNEDRGEIVGAYAIAMVNGYPMSKAMNIKDIIRYKEFSKSKNSEFSPWNVQNDPESWMYKKTVLKQLAKLVPKNETIYKAIAADNEDSIIADRLEGAKEESKSLSMGNLLKNDNQNKEKKGTKKDQDSSVDAESSQVNPKDNEPTIE